MEKEYIFLLRPSHLHQESVPLILALDGLDGDILSFPHGLEDDSKRSSSNYLEKKQHNILKQRTITVCVCIRCAFLPCD